jgi:hypothetical protein
MEEESREVLNTLPEHDFQDTAKQSQKIGISALVEVWATWPVGSELAFDQMTVPVPDMV